jgi:hypothetical protein
MGKHDDSDSPHANPSIALPPSPEAEFTDISITRTVLEERCTALAGKKHLRIYIKLSAAPPLGWSFLFAGIWQTMEYEDKAQAGIEGDAIWVQCAPEDMRTFHLPELKKAVKETNRSFRPLLDQKAANEQAQRQLDWEAHERLQELKRGLAAEGAEAEAWWQPRMLRPVLRPLSAGFRKLTELLVRRRQRNREFHSWRSPER